MSRIILFLMRSRLKVIILPKTFHTIQIKTSEKLPKINFYDFGRKNLYVFVEI
jgi:hypothetical protein